MLCLIFKQPACGVYAGKLSLKFRFLSACGGVPWIGLGRRTLMEPAKVI
jgi:hypothetical protein